MFRIPHQSAAVLAVIGAGAASITAVHDPDRSGSSHAASPNPGHGTTAGCGDIRIDRGSATVAMSPDCASAPGSGDSHRSGWGSSNGSVWQRFLPSWQGQLQSLLPPMVALADGSGYDAMAPLQPAPALSGGMADDDGGSDTITGVFHRLDPAKARLVLVQVVFRHGARTPLSNRTELWAGVRWDVCGQAYKAAAVRLFNTAGVENPTPRDGKQVSTILPGGCHKGELTLLGQAQARELGRRLRERYVAQQGFLPEAHAPGLLEARTTNIARTKASLRGVLTGLYPDLAEGEAADGQAEAADAGGGGRRRAAEPQRVTTSGDLDEILYADVRACPHLAAIQAAAKQAGRAALRADPEYEWARAEMSRRLGIDPASFDTAPWVFTDVHDILTSLEAHGKPHPPGLRGGREGAQGADGAGGADGRREAAEIRRLLEAIDRLATKEFSAEVAPGLVDSAGRTVLRLSMGRLLHVMVGNMRRAAQEGGRAAAKEAGAGAAPESGGPRMYMYSGHDSTIMPLLSALGHDVTRWPPYMTNVVLELWELPPAPVPAPAHTPAPGRTADGGAPAAPSVPPAGPGSPRYAVRVLRNLEELPLPHCPQGYFPSLSTFEREVVGPFLLSAEHHATLCTARVAHDTSMPTPQAKTATGAQEGARRRPHPKTAAGA